ncbi:MAG: hypothetical protein C4346_13200, partial [Chloroflexota bacterium]
MKFLSVHLPHPIQRRQEPRRWRRNLVVVVIASALALIWTRRRGWRAFTGGEASRRTPEPPSDIRAWQQRLVADNAQAALAPSPTRAVAHTPAPEVARAETEERPPMPVVPDQAAVGEAKAHDAMPRSAAPPPTVVAWQDELEGATAQAATAVTASSPSVEPREEVMLPMTTMATNGERVPMAQDVPTGTPRNQGSRGNP